MRLKQTEAEFQRAVIQYAELNAWRVYHVANVKKQLRSGSSVGFPDLVLVRDQILFIELKSNTGRVHAAQSDWITAIAQAGGKTDIWRPEDWDRIETVLKR